jgi:hypothetical protein
MTDSITILHYAESYYSEYGVLYVITLNVIMLNVVEPNKQGILLKREALLMGKYQYSRPPCPN